MATNPFDLKSLMAQAKSMQTMMINTQNELKNITVTGSSGAGLVKIHFNGLHQALNTEIDPSLMNDDAEMVADLITAAINSAHQQIETVVKERMSTLTQNLNLPEEDKS